MMGVIGGNKGNDSGLVIFQSIMVFNKVTITLISDLISPVPDFYNHAFDASSRGKKVKN